MSTSTSGSSSRRRTRAMCLKVESQIASTSVTRSCWWGMMFALMVKAGSLALRHAAPGKAAPHAKSNDPNSSPGGKQPEGQYPHPLSATIHFMRRAEPGPVQLHVTILNRAKKNANVSVSLHQKDAIVLHLIALFATSTIGTARCGLPRTSPRQIGSIPILKQHPS
jgi:acyl-coenzyme A thioesterase PaaI-like protein